MSKKFINTTNGVIHADYLALFQHYEGKGIAILDKNSTMIKYIPETELLDPRQSMVEIQQQLLAYSNPADFLELPNNGLVRKEMVSSTSIANENNIVLNGPDLKVMVWIECSSAEIAKEIAVEINKALTSDSRSIYPIEWDALLGGGGCVKNEQKSETIPLKPIKPQSKTGVMPAS